MKKSLLLFGSMFILLLLFSFFFYSCRKNDSLLNASTKNEVPSNLLQKAKEWYAKETNTSFSLSNNLPQTNPATYPNWKEAKLQKQSSGDLLIIVPFDTKLDQNSNLGINKKVHFWH